MDPSYVSVVDPNDLGFTLFAYLLHAASSAAQIVLALFLAVTGAWRLAAPRVDRRGLRGLGLPPVAPGDAGTWHGPVRLALAALLVAPLVVGAPFVLSLAAAVAACVIVALPLTSEPPARVVRALAVGAAAFTAAFIVWEGEDNLTLGGDLVVHGLTWRDEEVDWQRTKDPKSPKIGDLAPDFALQDPEGRVQFRLSDLRGKRPVALVFGSYT